MRSRARAVAGRGRHAPPWSAPAARARGEGCGRWLADGVLVILRDVRRGFAHIVLLQELDQVVRRSILEGNVVALEVVGVGGGIGSGRHDLRLMYVVKRRYNPKCDPASKISCGS